MPWPSSRLTRAVSRAGLAVRFNYLISRYDRPTAIMLLVKQAERPLKALIYLGVEVGTEVRIRPGLTVLPGEGHELGLRIGSNVFIGSDVLIDVTAPIDIGDDVTVSAGTQLWTHRNVGTGPLSGRLPPKASGLLVGAGSYLGARATVLESVREIGRECVVAAGAVLRESTPHRTTWAGVPAECKRRGSSAG